MGFPRNHNPQSGQILLVVVLAAVVALTVGLSVVSRTITNTRITTDEADSQKALSAAEAGVERLLSTGGSSQTTTFGNDSRFSATSTNISGEQILVNGGNEIDQDDGVDVWLSDYEPTQYANKWSGNLRVYWASNSQTDCTENAALELVLITGSDVASAAVTRYAFDPCSTRRSGNGFSPTSVSDPNQITTSNTNILGQDFNYYVTIPVTSGFIMRIVPLYADTRIAIRGYTSGNQPQNLPSQGKLVESTGTAGDATRKVRVYQGYPKLPTEYFPYSLFVPSP